jgi:hypothetical protein
MAKKVVKKKAFDAFSPYATMPVERYTFEREPVGFMQRISRDHLERIGKWNIEKFEDNLGYDIVYRITNMMAHGDKTVEEWYDFPATWWDHFKMHINLRYNLKLKVRLSKLATKTLIKNYCPHFTTSPQRSHIEFMLQRPLEWEDLSHE